MIVRVLGKYGGYPAPKGGTTSFLLEKDEKFVMLDMGSGSLSRAGIFTDILKIDYIFLTHFHNDHVLDLHLLCYLSNFYQKKFTIFCPQDEMIEKFSSPFFTFEKVKPSDTFSVENFSVKVTESFHGIPAVGYEIDGTYFSGDTLFKESVKNSIETCKMSFLNLFMPSDNHFGNHLMLSDILKMENTGKIYLTHIHKDFEKEIEEEIKASGKAKTIEIAEELKCYEN